MSEDPVKLTREELYKRIWEKPVRQVAEELGISDVGLAKICKKHNIPSPYRGYWARAESGRKPKPTSLPKAKEDAPSEIYFYPRPEAEKVEDKHPLDPDLREELDLALIQEDEITEPLLVRDTLQGAHPFIRQAKKSFDSARIDQYGRLLRYEGEAVLDLMIGRDSLTRGLRIYDAIYSGVKARGWNIEKDDKVAGGVVVMVLDHPIHLRLEERSTALPENEYIEHKWKIKSSYGSHVYKEIQKYAPTGKLVLKIENVPYRCSIKHKFSDRKEDSLEGQLADVF
jgi:hypothetical protein